MILFQSEVSENKFSSKSQWKQYFYPASVLKFFFKYSPILENCTVCAILLQIANLIVFMHCYMCAANNSVVDW